MTANRLPEAVDEWLAMLNDVGTSIGRTLAAVDARALEDDHASELEPLLNRAISRMDQRLETLAVQLDEVGHLAAEVGKELNAAEESLRGWVDGIAVVAGRISLNEGEQGVG